MPEIVSFETYAGTAAPFNFNGLVRHYYLRSSPEQGDVQVNLTPKGEREPRQPRDRARHPRAACRPRPARPERRSRWWSRRPARRCCRRCLPRSTGPTRRPAARSRPRCARASSACPSSSTSTIRYGAQATRVRARHRPGQSRILQGRAERRLRHDQRALSGARPSAIRIAAAGASRSRSVMALSKGDSDARRARRWRRRCRPTSFPASARSWSSATSSR